MANRKKNFKQKLAEITYTKPAMEKRILNLRKSLNEISSILNEKKK